MQKFSIQTKIAIAESLWLRAHNNSENTTVLKSLKAAAMELNYPLLAMDIDKMIKNVNDVVVQVEMEIYGSLYTNSNIQSASL